MRRLNTLSTLLLVLAATTQVSAAASEIRYPAFESISETSRGSAPQISTRELKVHVSHGPKRPPEDHSAGDIDQRALRSARDVASRVVSRTRENRYDLGFWQGMNRATHQAGFDPYERRIGFEDGLADPDAFNVGWSLGTETAISEARELAFADVAEQFRDLTQEPISRPRAPFVEPRVALPLIPVPEMSGLPMVGWGSVQGRTNLRHLESCRSARDVYDAGWVKSGRVFSRWESRQRRDSYWHSLDANQKGRFRVVFEYEFYKAWDREAESYRRSQRQGFRDGWRYGDRRARALNYRLGYRDGYVEALAQSSNQGYRDSFSRTFEDAYQVAYEDWNGQVRPEIRSVTFFDQNRDGVFEPGEEVEAYVEIANYGGVGGSELLSLAGRFWDSSTRMTVELAPRSIWRSETPAVARLSSEAPAKSDSVVAVTIGGDRLERSLRVGYPLELEGVRLVDHHAVVGIAGLAVDIENTSRLDRDFEVSVIRPNGELMKAVSVGRLSAGEARTLAVEVEHLDPLSFLAGDVRLAFEVSSRNRTLDRTAYRIPRLATRLDDRALIDYLLMLGSDGSWSPLEAQKAQRLFLLRLREDWKVAVARGGNRYKTDRLNGTSETSLGDLVQSLRRSESEMVSRRVFEELSPQIVALADDLPGYHPFLKKHFKKLARELG